MKDCIGHIVEVKYNDEWRRVLIGGNDLISNSIHYSPRTQIQQRNTEHPIAQ